MCRNRAKCLLMGFMFPLSFMLTSCLSSTSSDSDEYTKAIDKYGKADENFSNRPITLAEFELNYVMLDLFYLHAHTKHELGDPGEYYGQGENTIFAKRPFADTYLMYNRMSCKFTNYFDPEYVSQISLEDQLFYSESNVGFGFLLDTLNQSSTGLAVIEDVFLNGPAEAAGFQEGDTLLTIDDESALRSIVERAEKRSKDKEKHTFVVKRQSDTLELKLTAASFMHPTVYVTHKGSIPIITITEFTDTTNLTSGTYGEFVKALEKTKDSKAIVIDLANNGGGSVDHCMPMSAELLPKNTTLGYSVEAAIDSSKRSYKQKIDTVKIAPSDYGITDEGIASDRYVVFVQDGNTASCSELMISSVSASKNTPVVGTQSYGKGIAQLYFQTIAGGYCGITNGQLYDKNMRSYHSYGIEPDIKIEDHREALLKAVEIASEGTYKRTAGYSAKPSGNFFAALARESSSQFNRLENFGAFKVRPIPEFLIK